MFTGVGILSLGFLTLVCFAAGLVAVLRAEGALASRGRRAAAVLSSRLLAGPTYPDEDPTAVVVEAALARCGPSLDAVLRGADDPHAQVGRFGPDAERMAADLLEAERPPAAVVPQPLLDADTRAAAAAQLFGARLTPELARAAQDATSVVRSAERLVAASPYRRAVAQIAARHHPGGKGGWPEPPPTSGWSLTP